MLIRCMRQPPTVSLVVWELISPMNTLQQMQKSRTFPQGNYPHLTKTGIQLGCSGDLNYMKFMTIRSMWQQLRVSLVVWELTFLMSTLQQIQTSRNYLREKYPQLIKTGMSTQLEASGFLYGFGKLALKRFLFGYFIIFEEKCLKYKNTII